MRLSGMFVLGGLSLLAVALTSCAGGITNQPVNCNVVKLSRQNGQSVADIAETFHVTEAEINKCGTGPVEVTGGDQPEGSAPDANASPAAAEGGAGASGAGAGDAGSSGGSSGGAGSGGGDSGAAKPGLY